MIKKISTFLASVSAFALATPALAQEASAGPATFAGSYTLWIAIIIGFVASFMAFRYGRQLKGSVTSGILNLFAAGMFFVVLGFLSVVVAWADAPVQKITHDLLFIVGYIFMLVGAGRVRKLSA